MKKVICKFSVFFIIIALFFSAVPKVNIRAASDIIRGPIFKDDMSFVGGRSIQYDIVSFGMYPQAEVVTTDIAKNYYSDVISDVRTMPNGKRVLAECLSDEARLCKWFQREDDLIIDDNVYQKLSSGVVWDGNNECIYNGVRYRRISKNDYRGYLNDSAYETIVRDTFKFYNWDSKFHYFAYQPIKWRVLSVENGYLLLSDKCLDYERFFFEKAADGSREHNWRNSNIRSWLNGFGPDENMEKTDYTGKGFIDYAFTDQEKEVIENDSEKKAKVYLPSATMLINEAYGFLAYDENGKSQIDSSKKSQASVFARAKGCSGDGFTGGSTEYCCIESVQWLTDQKVNGQKNWMRCIDVNGRETSLPLDYYCGIRPVIRVIDSGVLNLTKCGVYCSSELKERVVSSGASVGGVSAPVIRNADNKYGYEASYDCVYYGEYPQAEIVSASLYESYSDRIVSGSALTDGDLIVNDALYNYLQNASWSGDTIAVQGHRFCRVNSQKPVFTNLLTEKPFYANSYNWEDKDSYHYFVYQPIKWVVLDVKGDDILLMADKVLDDKQYCKSHGQTTWAQSYIRQWLNSDFYNDAFSDAEKKDIIESDVVTADSPNGSSGGFSSGGSDTKDRLYFLSYYELQRSFSAYKYGFNQNGVLTEPFRAAKSTTFAKAMGCQIKYEGNSDWWLRTSAPASYNVTIVYDSGMMSDTGVDAIGGWGQRNSSLSVVKAQVGVRPVMWIKAVNNDNIVSAGKRNTFGDVISEPKQYDCSDILFKDISDATVTNIGTVAWTGNEIKPTVTVEKDGIELRNGIDYTVSYKNNKNAGTATIVISGKGEYTGTLNKNYFIKKANLKYRAYVQKKGWMKPWTTAGVGTKVNDDKFAGTLDNLRMETIQMQLSGIGGSVKYRAYVQKDGWTQWATTAKKETFAGTKGQSKRVEMIQLKTAGQVGTLYDMYYRTYCEKFGWLGWAGNNEKSGSAGYARKLEAFQVQFVPKGTEFDRGTKQAFYDVKKDGK